MVLLTAIPRFTAQRTATSSLGKRTVFSLPPPPVSDHDQADTRSGGSGGRDRHRGIVGDLAFGQASCGENAEASRQQAEQIARLSAENERLSNQVAQGNSPQPLAPEELGELLRLRGQIGLLRQTEKEQAQLEATNAQLRAALAASEKQLAEARAAPNFWAKDQLASPVTPTRKLRSRRCCGRCAMATSSRTWRVGLPGRMSTCCSRANSGKRPTPKSRPGASCSQRPWTPPVGFHILDKNVKSPDQVILNLSFDGEGKARKFVVQRTGSEWKVADMLRPGQAEP